LAIAISAIREKVGVGFLGSFWGGRVFGSLGHETLLSGRGPAQLRLPSPRSKSPEEAQEIAGKILEMQLVTHH